jgi:hypothetical protein
MKMCRRMFTNIHSYDDSEKSAYFWHTIFPFCITTNSDSNIGSPSSSNIATTSRSFWFIVLCITRYKLNLSSVRPEPVEGQAGEEQVSARGGGNVRPFDKALLSKAEGLRANGWGLHRHLQWQSPGEWRFIAN